MDRLQVSMSSSMLNGSHEVQSNAINQLYKGGTAAANTAMSSQDNAARTNVMQAQGIGQSLNITA